MPEAWNKIEEQLTALYSGYPEKVASLGRREADWQLCSSRIFTEVELLNAYAAATVWRVPEDDELEEIAPWPEISVDYLNFWCCLPYRKEGGRLAILVADPYAVEQHDSFFHQIWGVDTEYLLIRRSKLEHLIADTYNHRDENNDRSSEDDGDDVETLTALAGEAKIVRLVNEMFNRAVEMRASDIHVEPEEERLTIRFRVDGVLNEYQTYPKSDYPAIASRIKLISGLNIAESRVPQDGRTRYSIGRSEMDLRVSTLPTMNGESIVLRLLKKDAISFDLGNVGMLPDMQEKFDRLISIPHGIVLVVGPTGSGKTTTLYSVITKLNDHHRKIITVEDPVEYRLPGLSQMQVNEKIGVTFASGLRSIVRQDPDIILVGEIRDRETADIAINAALTGHLVFSTLHTNDAAGAVSRLLDMGVQSFLLASALFGVVSQRLVRKICPHCNGSCIDAERGGKCRECNGSGFRGRMGIFEMMIVNEELRQAINASSTSQKIEELARKNGMTSIFEDGMLKVEAGLTTADEVKRSASEI